RARTCADAMSLLLPCLRDSRFLSRHGAVRQEKIGPRFAPRRKHDLKLQRTDASLPSLPPETPRGWQGRTPRGRSARRRSSLEEGTLAMSMVCPQCQQTHEQLLECPKCQVRLLYQATSLQPSAAPRTEREEPSQWQQSPWAKMLVGLLLAQGL